MSSLAFSIRKYLTESDLVNISIAIVEYIFTWQSIAPDLKLSEPLKLHILLHVLEFCDRYKCTTASYSEQDGESLHRCFRKVLDRTKGQGKKSLEVAVKRFNASNF